MNREELRIIQVKVYCYTFQKIFQMNGYFYCIGPVLFLLLLLCIFLLNYSLLGF